MIVYWDLVMLFNFLTDYLLLYGTVQMSGFGIRRRRIALGAFAGSAYAVIQLFFPRSGLCMLAVLLLMGVLTFYGTGRTIRMTLLFALLSCAFGGSILLLGQLCGSRKSLARSILFAQLPWGVFLISAVLSYLLLGVVFRGGAQHTDNELTDVTIIYRGKSVTLTLLCDTGNMLTDPQTGMGVPVISEGALHQLLSPEEVRRLPCIPFCCVGVQQGYLPVFRCEELYRDGKSLGERLVAVSFHALSGGRYVGLWCEGSEGGANVQNALA